MRLHFAGLSMSFVRRSYAFLLRAHGVHGVLTECPRRSWSPHSIANALPRRSHCVLLRTQSHGVAIAWSLGITKCAQLQGVLGVPNALCCVVMALPLRCMRSHCVQLGVQQRSGSAVGTRPGVTGALLYSLWLLDIVRNV